MEMRMAETPGAHGSYIRARRKALGLTQAALAREARVTPAMINRLESGQRHGRPPLLRQLADALQVSPAELLERAGYRTEAEDARTQAAPDPLARVRYAVGAAPLRPAVRTAFLTLVSEFCRDPEAGFRQRFEDAAATASAQHGATFAGLHELLFAPAAGPPTGDGAPP
jgi:transcriptional regulator with XRE-family HTH domain